MCSKLVKSVIGIGTMVKWLKKAREKRQLTRLSTALYRNCSNMSDSESAQCESNRKLFTCVPRVDIDPSGVFKYILLKVHDPMQVNQNITIVRGYQRHEYHSDIYDEVQERLKPLDCEPLGGGRISHEPKDNKIHIYGYSQGYGKADHEVAAKLIKKEYPGYTISVSDEGY